MLLEEHCTFQWFPDAKNIDRLKHMCLQVNNYVLYKKLYVTNLQIKKMLQKKNVFHLSRV